MKHRWPQRWMPMLWNALRNAIPPAAGLISSVVIIRTASLEVWGNYARYLIVIHFGVTFANWGSRLYLLRAFSDQPQRWQELWLTNIKTRLPLLILPIALMCTVVQANDALPPLLLWFVCLFGIHAFEPAIIFHHRYILGILNDLAGTAVFLGLSLWSSEMQHIHLIWATCMAALCRLIILLIAWRNTFRLWFRVIAQWNQLKHAWALAMQNISGLLVSKMDTYSVAVLLPPSELGVYHIVMNVLSFLQALPEFAISTQLKNLYRLQASHIRRMGLQSLFAGSLLTALGVVCLIGILWFIEDTRVPITALAVGFLFVLPMYVYLPYVHALLKQHKSIIVLRLSLIGALVNLTGNILFIPSLGLTGAIASAALTQWLLLGAYVLQSGAPEQSVDRNTPLSEHEAI
ncbi:hypothetical protein L6Q79_13720 [bacterium]|nr:hypothetical protein [bacterium]NUN46744.1 polysaccharide biosynthesis C-terminal domain-containing protein [bacterium]